MSYITGDLVDMNALQIGIENTFTSAPNVNTAQKVPFLEALLSPLNSGNINQLINSSGRGKVRTIQVNYMDEFNDNDINTDVSNPNCDTGAVQGDKYAEYSIDTTENREIKRSFSRTDLVDAVRDNPNYMNELVLKMMYQMERAISAKSASEAVALTGSWGAEVEDIYTVTANQLVVETLQSGSNYAPVFQTIETINTASMLTGYNNGFIGFGGTQLPSYLRWAQVGSPSDAGIDFMQMYEKYGFGVEYDFYVKDALGGNDETLIMAPGALQLLTYVASPWRDGMPLVIEGSNYAQTQVVTPRVGLPCDFIVIDNCGNITVKLIATTKVVGMPTDMFNANNNFDGVTMVNQIKVTNTAP